MWKRDDPQKVSPPSHSTPSPSSRSDELGTSRSGSGVQQAAIGRSIRIRGDVTGDEDLLIHGTIEGSVTLAAHTLTVGPEGDLRANVRARIVKVKGRVRGDLVAEEQVVLQASARVQGDISAPRVVLEDGARFRGEIDMGDPDEGLSAGDKGEGRSGEGHTREGLMVEGHTAGGERKGANAKSSVASDESRSSAGKARTPVKTGS